MKRRIDHIIIHCSATPNGKDIRAKDIDVMHKARSFTRNSQAKRNFNPHLGSIGYHQIVCVDGVIETGRGLEEVGAHVAGKNSNSIGVCMIGLNKYTEAQWKALRQTLINLAGTIIGRPIATLEGALDAFKTMGISVKGHRDYSPDLNGDGQITRNEWVKDCPNFDVTTWLKGGAMPLQSNLHTP